jgi:hypothetical protein
MAQSIDELKAQRDLAFDKAEKAANKVKRAVDGGNERAVNRAQEELNLMFERYEALHISYAARAKIPVSNPELKETYDALAALVAETDEAAMVFLEGVEARKERDSQAREAQTETAAKARRQKALMDDANREAEMLAAHMVDLADRMKQQGQTAWRPEPAVLVQETLYCEKKFEGVRSKLEEAADGTEDAERRGAILAGLLKLEMDFRKIYMELKSYGWHGGGGGGGQSSTPSLDNSGRASEEGGEKFKNQKIDYPRFAGDVRQYLTFK